MTGTSASSAEVAGCGRPAARHRSRRLERRHRGPPREVAADVGSRVRDRQWPPRPGPRRRGSRRSVPVKPEGAAPTGDGGPFVGPYVAASATVLPSTTLNGSTGTVAVLPGRVDLGVMVVQTTAVISHNWDSSSWAIADSVPLPAAMTCVNHGEPRWWPGTFTEVFPITAPLTPGTYNLYLVPWNSDPCAGPFVHHVHPPNRDRGRQHARPTVTINQAAGQADPTNASPIHFTVVLQRGRDRLRDRRRDPRAAPPAARHADRHRLRDHLQRRRHRHDHDRHRHRDRRGRRGQRRGRQRATRLRPATDNTVTLRQRRPRRSRSTRPRARPDPTNASPINFTVVFSESVTDFATGDVTFTGTAGGTITGTVTGSGDDLQRGRHRHDDDRHGHRHRRRRASRPTPPATPTPPRPAPTTPSPTTPPRPTVTINQAAGQADPTNTQPDQLHGRVQRVGHRLRDRRRHPRRHRRGDGHRTVTGSGDHLQRRGHRHDHRRHGHRDASRPAPRPTRPATPTPRRPAPTTRSPATTRRPTVTINQAVGQADPTEHQPDQLHGRVQRAGHRLRHRRRDARGHRRRARRPAPSPAAGTTYNVAVTGMTTPARSSRPSPPARRDRPRRQRQHGLDQHRQHGHLRQRRADRHDQPGGRPGRPDEHQPDQLHGRLQRAGHRLRRPAT